MNAIAPELLRQVPGCESGAAPLAVQTLPGGRGVNGVWRVRTRAGDFVLRLRHEPVDRPGSTSRFELGAHRLAAAAGLAPTVVNAAPDGRWLIMDFVDSPPWSEAKLLSDAGIDALGGLLRRLHALPCAGLPRMDVPGIARGYFAAIGDSRNPADKVEVALAALERDSQALAGLSGRAVLNHGDLMAANVLDRAAQGPTLVDWEYAQCADPTWDVACLLAYYPGLESRLDRLLAACGLSSAEDRRILSLQRCLFEGLDRLWQQAEAGNWIS